VRFYRKPGEIIEQPIRWENSTARELVSTLSFIERHANDGRLSLTLLVRSEACLFAYIAVGEECKCLKKFYVGQVTSVPPVCRPSKF